jgi:hypothetical protein
MQRLVGTITVPAGNSRNNHDTAVPFAVPPTARKVELYTDDADIRMRWGPDGVSFDQFDPAAYAPPFATQSTLAATVNDVKLDAGFAKTVDLNHYGAPHVFAAFSTAGGSVKVSVKD